MSRARIAVLVSGGGTNLEALFNAQEAGNIPHGEIVVVLSSTAGAYALERARNHGVPGFAGVSHCLLCSDGQLPELYGKSLSKFL